MMLSEKEVNIRSKALSYILRAIPNLPTDTYNYDRWIDKYFSEYDSDVMNMVIDFYKDDNNAIKKLILPSIRYLPQSDLYYILKGYFEKMSVVYLTTLIDSIEGTTSFEFNIDMKGISSKPFYYKLYSLGVRDLEFLTKVNLIYSDEREAILNMYTDGIPMDHLINIYKMINPGEYVNKWFNKNKRIDVLQDYYKVMKGHNFSKRCLDLVFTIFNYDQIAYETNHLYDTKRYMSFLVSDMGDKHFIDSYMTPRFVGALHERERLLETFVLFISELPKRLFLFGKSNHIKKWFRKTNIHDYDKCNTHKKYFDKTLSIRKYSPDEMNFIYKSLLDYASKLGKVDVFRQVFDMEVFTKYCDDGIPVDMSDFHYTVMATMNPTLDPFLHVTKRTAFMRLLNTNYSVSTIKDIIDPQMLCVRDISTTKILTKMGDIMR